MLAGNQRASLLLLIEQSATRADTTLRRERAATSLQAYRAKLAHLEVVTKLATLEWWCFGTPYTAFRESKTQRVSTVATPRTAGGNRSRVAAPDATGDDDEMPRFLHDAEAQLRQFQGS
ncbi:hypothetical protein EMIHUDRAFT_199901 [Emiliania huxleyi CCMP1516]|uniref:Uncharacterized protein n=2 Tax=Emiliania huxleyi TaxID=2903 RepID=A0A0D3I5R7_EMIH1|nr:hypothetical protein EMIHUDRAFT_219136 [Emiliania huxleyi CCMP1516]XP_005791875.1 hypothetical protein EMIHUDRAFT_199901 [Emiliania huxleyi CCMP1516]EOD06602.1 hypothetical protein EMIHUDRAFT_219136 [Emiliania huxleyi CCMP1516]EOD39446.1 hypothetical protein EMIHUDRAFT_199901 [Emiliania huxleyi CCMP1516]|eukprot:XP_005759031.1 hypothetical protein EMIHUDRAFT_219136 [Emiliania huxleyi CCMP1516]